MIVFIASYFGETQIVLYNVFYYHNSNHRTASSYGYGLVSAVESKKMGRIDNFWLKSLLRLKHHNVAVNKKINAENVFLSCDLTCDGIQIGGSSNVKTTTTIEDELQNDKEEYIKDESSSSADEKETDLSRKLIYLFFQITREDDNNPFIGQTGENIRWSHAIDSVVINNASENDWTTQDLHRFLLESTN
ncbi:unnamed protein product [Rhizophagus irregularis]|nr:unnamed protein product [Rhizophagus irregularis]